MDNQTLLSKLVKKIELEILTSEESALIGGTADSILAGNNCKCNGNNCDCNIPAPDPDPYPNPKPIN